SGSGQQSVTGFAAGDDPNSYFLVQPAYEKTCTRGTPIKCNTEIRLEHMNTNKYLHSHAHQSPLSGNQEVSAYEFTDLGDNWKVVCHDKKAVYWKREEKVRFLHEVTGKYLSSNAKYQFRNPIPGQLEISATKSAGNNELWQVQEGIFFPKIEEKK
ncbi:Stromal cell-derived factor 2-like protein 1, partial [Blyttiomyces sp. JEL0837]